MSDEGPYAAPVPAQTEAQDGPCAVTQLVQKMAVQGLHGVVDERRVETLIAAIDAAVLADDEPGRRALAESANEVRLRVDMAAELIELVARLMTADHRSAHEYARQALKRLAGETQTNYLTWFARSATSQGLLPDKIVEDLTAQADSEPWPLPAMLSERRRWHDDSVHLNTLSWRIAEAIGKVPEGAERIESDVDEDLTQLIEERDALRAQVASLDPGTAH